MGEHEITTEVIEAFEQACIETHANHLAVRLEVGTNALKRAGCSPARHARAREIEHEVKAKVVERPCADLNPTPVAVEGRANRAEARQECGDKMRPAGRAHQREVPKPLLLLRVQRVGHPAFCFGTDGRFGLLRVHRHKRVVVHGTLTTAQSLNARPVIGNARTLLHKSRAEACRMTDDLLVVEDLHAEVEGTPILNGVNLRIKAGERHAIMGLNGAGKSTLASVLMGHPAYTITGGTVQYNGAPLDDLEVFERARAGMFLSFQYPSAIPGVQVGTFLRRSVAAVRGEAPKARAFREELKTAMDKLGMDRSFLARYVNDGFSGGEKKRLEILQMMLLQPRLALLDETDSGLDIDAMRAVAGAINSLPPTSGILLITHYKRLLELVVPDVVHVMIDGRIVESGGPEVAERLEQHGYDGIVAR